MKRGEIKRRGEAGGEAEHPAAKVGGQLTSFFYSNSCEVQMLKTLDLV